MAEELGGGVTIPTTGLDGGAKGIISQLMGRADQSAKYNAEQEAEFKASREREAQARAAQAATLGPKRAELKSKLSETPKQPEFAAQPEAPSSIGIDPKEMNETLSLVTALAAVGGLLTRQPLTAALNNFSAGIHGFVQGKQEVFSRELKAFDANLKKSNAENETIWKKYKAAQDKYGTDIQALQNEISVIAAETQNPIDMEMAKRGDIVSLMKLHEQTNNNYNKVLEKTGEFLQKAEDRKAQRETEMAKAGIASSDRRFAAQLASDDKRFLEEGRDRRAGEANATRRDIATQKINAMREKGEKSGLKGKMLESYVHNEANIDTIDGLITALAENPDAVGWKTLVPGLLLNRADPDGTPIRASIGNLKSMTIKDRAGTAQTASEMRNLKPFIPIDGEDVDTTVTKLRGLQKAMRDMNSTVGRLVGTPTGGAPAGGAAPQSFATEAEATAANLAPGTRVVIGGVPGTWK